MPTIAYLIAIASATSTLAELVWNLLRLWWPFGEADAN